MQPTVQHPALDPVGAFLQALFGSQAADAMKLQVVYTEKQQPAADNTCGLIAALESSNARFHSEPFEEQIPALRERVVRELGDYLGKNNTPELVKKYRWSFAPLPCEPPQAHAHAEAKGGVKAELKEAEKGPEGGDVKMGEVGEAKEEKEQGGEGKEHGGRVPESAGNEHMQVGMEDVNAELSMGDEPLQPGGGEIGEQVKVQASAGADSGGGDAKGGAGVGNPKLLQEGARAGAAAEHVVVAEEKDAHMFISKDDKSKVCIYLIELKCCLC